MTGAVKVLYEDRQAPDVNEFGLHVLVRRCVLDRLGWAEDRFGELKGALIGRAKKGDSSLLKACADPREARSFRRVIAVFDDDKIRGRLGLSPGACKAEVRAAITRQSAFPELLTVVLLGRNMESVVTAVQGCRGKPETEKLRLPDRDAVLASIAWRPDYASLRECVLARVPSLEYLVARLAKIVRDQT